MPYRSVRAVYRVVRPVYRDIRAPDRATCATDRGVCQFAATGRNCDWTAGRDLPTPPVSVANAPAITAFRTSAGRQATVGTASAAATPPLTPPARICLSPYSIAGFTRTTNPRLVIFAAVW